MNLRPLEPHSSALPDCATSRLKRNYYLLMPTCQEKKLVQPMTLSNYACETLLRGYESDASVETNARVRRDVELPCPGILENRGLSAYSQNDGGSMRIYQAGPLFTATEIRWHKDFTKQLTHAGYDVQWPGDFSRSRKSTHRKPTHPKKIIKMAPFVTQHPLLL